MDVQPKRGTVMLTARCRRCDGVLYRYPGGSWWHDDGSNDCEPVDVTD